MNSSRPGPLGSHIPPQRGEWAAPCERVEPGPAFLAAVRGISRTRCALAVLAGQSAVDKKLRATGPRADRSRFGWVTGRYWPLGRPPPAARTRSPGSPRPRAQGLLPVRPGDRGDRRLERLRHPTSLPWPPHRGGKFSPLGGPVRRRLLPGRWGGRGRAGRGRRPLTARTALSSSTPVPRVSRRRRVSGSRSWPAAARAGADPGPAGVVAPRGGSVTYPAARVRGRVGPRSVGGRWAGAGTARSATTSTGPRPASAR